MINNFKKLNPFKWFMLENFPFIEADFDAITNYQLFCKLAEFANKINNNTNALGIKVEELNNYIMNLDLQDEVDAKLDEMAQNGTLANIITEYLNIKSILCYNSVEEMKQAENLINGSFIKTYGYYDAKDGGGAFYKVRPIENTDNIDNMTLFALSNPTLVAEFIKTESFINPLQFGAKGDGESDDYIPFQKAINLSNVELTRKSYYLSDSIKIPSNKTFAGNNASLIPANAKYALYAEGNGVENPVVEITIKDVQINATKNGGYGVSIIDGYFIYIDNVNIIQLTGNNAIGFNIENGFNHVISNSRVYGNTQYNGQIGLNIHTTTESNGIENMTNCKYDTLLLQNLEYGVKANYTTGANMVTFENTGFSNNTYGFYIEGTVRPITFNNTRMEGGTRVTGGQTIYGFYFKGTVDSTIFNLNAYNIPAIIHNESSSGIVMLGSITCTGTTQTNKFYLIEKSNASIKVLGNLTLFSNVYNARKGDAFTDNPRAIINYDMTNFTNDVSVNYLNTSNTGTQITKVTSSILNIFGQKGTKQRIWTDQTGLVIYGSANSTTNKWSGSITLEPYKIYNIIMLEDNIAGIES